MLKYHNYHEQKMLPLATITLYPPKPFMGIKFLAKNYEKRYEKSDVAANRFVDDKIIL